MIDFEGATRRFGSWTAVDDLTLTIPQGAFCALIGRSGAGKSTALKMINRLVEPDAGSVRIEGEPVSRFPVEELRRRTGYVIQSVGLFPHWTVERNIATVPGLLRWPKARIRDRVTELLDFLQLDPERFRGLYPHQLSGGQQQRVGVARALAADPKVLLMDEPFGALDPITRASLRTELARIHRETGKTIVFVTHDMDEALTLATHIALMDQGRLVQYAPPAEILTAPAGDFVRDFIGRDGWGLRLLSVETVGQRLRPPADDLVEGAPDPSVAGGQPLSASMPLDRALSEMIARGTDHLPVVDADDRPAGTLHLADLVRR